MSYVSLVVIKALGCYADGYQLESASAPSSICKKSCSLWTLSCDSSEVVVNAQSYDHSGVEVYRQGLMTLHTLWFMEAVL